MQNILIQLELISRIDRLIRMQATGSPSTLARRLDISKTKLHRIINTMKALGAPIVYDVDVQSYIYEEVVGFSYGFYLKSNTAKSAFQFTS
ncbi:hypothetical protein M0D21_04560 [Aquimarina sp. D1M17]|uniref:hypothetical protein n=1 Tax=Aquimarina acroporae TaxID=2937283 RepID=UPI0020BE0CB5|nr:hypothetical protein [Aquimarina acroporae]MCK8520822.1 hypothetical protein [Aquimarina acroporae]